MKSKTLETSLEPGAVQTSTFKKANSWEPLRWDRRVSPGWPSQRH